ncbi:hypothetical protein AB4K20DRAFT_1982756 [Rhizopus microsporus]
MKSRAPIPVKGIQMALSKKCLVIKVDEYRTSVVCSSCHGELQKVYEPENALNCNHRKKLQNLPIERWESKCECSKKISAQYCKIISHLILTLSQDQNYFRYTSCAGPLK